MAKEEKEEKAAPEEIPETKVAEVDEQIKEIVGVFGEYSKVMLLMPRIRTAEGDVIPGPEYLDPKKPDQRKRFLTKPDYLKARKQLLKRLQVWKSLLSSAAEIAEVRRQAEERAAKIEENLHNNLSKIFEEIRPLETTYRQVDRFFMNAAPEPDEPVNAWFVNASLEELSDPDDRTKFEEFATYIQNPYRSFSLTDCYSLMVLPGFLEDVQTMDRFAELGAQNKVHVFTDLPDFDSVTEAMEFLDDPAFASLSGSTDEKSYLSIGVNYLLGRPKNQYEQEDLWISPSTVLAGLVYKNDEGVGVQQPSAGYKHGRATGVDHVKFRVNQRECTSLADRSTIPAVDWDGLVRYMNDATLFKGENYNIYAVRRTRDYILKNVAHYLNKQTFILINNRLLDTIKKDIYNFLTPLKGEGRMIEDFEIKVTSTPEQRKKQVVDVNLTIKCFFPAKTFNIYLQPHNTEEGTKVEM